MASIGGSASSGPARSMAVIQEEMAEQMSVIMNQGAGKCRQDHVPSSTESGVGRDASLTSQFRSMLNLD